MAKGGSRHEFEVDPIRNAAIVFTPRHFVCVLIEILTADPVMDAVFSYEDVQAAMSSDVQPLFPTAGGPR